MKKVLLLCLAVMAIGFGVYSCQQDKVEPVLPAIDESTTVGSRADYSTCEECYENCNDCCLNFVNTGSVIAVLAFTDPATGNVVTRKVYGGQDTVVCAAGGYLAILGGNSATATVTVCSDPSETLSKPAGIPYLVSSLTWDCKL